MHCSAPINAKLDIRMELPSVGMIKAFVTAGLGVSLVSASFARDEVKMGSAKLIPLQGVELWRELGLAYHADRTHAARRHYVHRCCAAVGEG